MNEEYDRYLNLYATQLLGDIILADWNFINPTRMAILTAIEFIKKKYRRAVCKILYFALLPIAAFAYWMSLVSEDIERFYGELDREIYPNKHGNRQNDLD